MTDIPLKAGTFRLVNVFSKAFTIYGRRFAAFIILTVVVSIPNYIAILKLAGLTGRLPAEFGGAQAILVLVNMATKSLVSAAVTCGVIQELCGRAFSVRDSIRITLSRILEHFPHDMDHLVYPACLK